MTEEKNTNDIFKKKGATTLAGLESGPEFDGTTPMKADDYCELCKDRRSVVEFVKVEERTSTDEPKGKGKKGGRKKGEKYKAVIFRVRVEGTNGVYRVMTSGKAFVDKFAKFADKVPFIVEKVVHKGSGTRGYYAPY